MEPHQSIYPLNTFAELVEAFNGFLITAIHTILYTRELVPPNTFLMRRKYNCAVPQQRNPELCAWIINICSAVKDQILGNIVQCVILEITHHEIGDVERWCFDVDEFPVVPEDMATAVLMELDVSVVDIEQQMRAALQNILACRTELPPLPQDCAYTLGLVLKDMAELSQLSSELWIDPEPSEEDDYVAAPQVVRIRSIQARRFILDMWVETLAWHDDDDENELSPSISE